MKKVNPNVRITVADTISDTLIRIYKEACAASPDGALSKDTALSEMAAEIETLSADLTTAIKATKISTSLEDADAKRDELVRQLGTLLSGYAVIPVAEKKAAAVSLLSVYDKYGKAIVNEAYARESSLIESLLEDFAEESLSSAVSALDGVSDTLTSLRTAQDEFNAANDSATAALSEKGESAYAIKKTVLASINEKLVPYITAMSALNSEYASYSAKADIEIAKANASASKKKSSESDSASAE